MQGYFYKLIPPRPTFPADMTPAEGKLMQKHAAYWTRLMEKGKVIAFGPVADPKGTFGIAILCLEEGDDANALGANDPVIFAKAGFTYEVHPMPVLRFPQ